MFQLFGYATFRSTPLLQRKPDRTRSIARQIVRYRYLIYPITFLLCDMALILYAISTRITLMGSRNVQLNVICDQIVFVIVLITQQVALIEALLRHRHTVQLYERYYVIAERLASNGRHPLIHFGRRCRRMLLHNSVQFFGLGGQLALGIGMTGVESWKYLRWIVMSMMAVNVRLIEVSMHVEIVGALMRDLETLLVALSAVGDSVERDERLRDAAETYGLLHGLTGTINRQYGASILMFTVYALMAITSTSYWALNVMSTGVTTRLFYAPPSLIT